MTYLARPKASGTLDHRQPHLIGLSGALLLMLWLLPIGGVQAKSDDRQQAIEVNADQSVFDQKKQLQILSGNVLIQQGSLRIEASEVQVRLKDNALYSIIATGNPTRFSQLSDSNEKTVGTCSRLEYRALEDLLVLQGEAKLAQPGSSLTGQKIEFDTARSVVRANGDKKQRVRIIINSPNS